MKDSKYYIASFSGGKDSTAMVLHLMELGKPLDEVIYCDTTMEFPEMEKHIQKVKAIIEQNGIKFTKLQAEHDFEWFLLNAPQNPKNELLKGELGYSWAGPKMRWCTSEMKTKVIKQYLSSIGKAHDVIQYIGIAADEQYRLERKGNQQKGHVHPLVEWGWTEAHAMAYCREMGFDWGGLYDIFDRVSCWCCPLQSLDDFRTLRKYFPDLWCRLEWLDSQTRRTIIKNYSVKDLNRRFELEEAYSDAGIPTHNRPFFQDMRSYINGGTTIDDLIRTRRT